jgi:hypothetical protein
MRAIAHSVRPRPRGPSGLLQAVAEIEGREPIMVIPRIELAATFSTTVCKCDESAEAIGSPSEGPNLLWPRQKSSWFGARKIYAQEGSSGSE